MSIKETHTWIGRGVLNLKSGKIKAGDGFDGSELDEKVLSNMIKKKTAVKGKAAYASVSDAGSKLKSALDEARKEIETLKTSIQDKAVEVEGLLESSVKEEDHKAVQDKVVELEEALKKKDAEIVKLKK